MPVIEDGDDVGGGVRELDLLGLVFLPRAHFDNGVLI